MSPTAQGVDRICRLARRAERRLRTGRTLGVLAQSLSAALLCAIAIVALRKLGALSEPAARALLAVSAAPVAVAAVIAWAWRLPEKAGARALDRFHGLHDRLASALAFAEIAEAERTPFMHAAMADAADTARSVVPRKAVPIAFPRAFIAVGGLSAVLAGVSLFEVRRHVPLAHAKTIDAIEMAPDDLQDVKDFLKQEDQRESSDDTKAAVEEFNKLVDDIAERRLDRTEAFRRMEVLEQKFLTSDAVDEKALERRLEGLGEDLKKAELSRPAGRALADQDLAKAEASLRELAKKMRSQEAPVDKAKLDELRQALKKAADEREKNADALARRRDQLADEILKLKEKMGDGGGTDEERSLLDKKKEELERLDRDTSDPNKKNEQKQALDRLDRDIQQAAEDLLRDLGASAQDLDQGAEDLNHLQEQQMTQQQKEELRQKLQEMRELLRQQGQGGKGQMLRLKRFARMARGEGGSRGESANGQDGENGQQGQGQNGQQGQGQQGQQGQGQQGQGQQGQGGAGQGDRGNSPGQGGETWVIGPNGEKLLLLSRGSGEGQGGPQAGQGGEGGEGQGKPGSWGEGHDPNVQGKATASKMGTEEAHVEGADTGQGSSRSQVIQGAAERGFASRSYRKVYTEYHQVAEESLAKDDIPDGYRSFVKRYFQLIRPREQP
jgi:hypothetical protein